MYYKASPLQSFALLESGYACYRCCKVLNESECLPEPPPPALSQKLPNGRPCFHGVCVEVSIYQYIKMVLILTKLSVQFRYCHYFFMYILSVFHSSALCKVISFVGYEVSYRFISESIIFRQRCYNK